jgi:uncharacterized protein YabE (DUF348 family)
MEGWPIFTYKDFSNKYLTRKYIIPAASIFTMLLIIIVIMNAKTFTVAADGGQKKFITFKHTVAEALETKKITIGPKDKIEPALDSIISKGDTVTIKRAVSVEVTVDDKRLDILSAEEDVASMFDAEGISLGTEDRVEPGKDTKLSSDMEIVITRVETKTLAETVPVDFKEVIKKDSRMANTKHKVTQEGKAGEKQITYRAVYEDNKEVSREATGETITKEPVDRIVVQGTYPLMPVAKDGSIMAYSRVFEARATAYWAVRGVGRTYTASGRKAVRNPEGYSTIAVDRDVIPYGTKLFIEGYGFAIAADTGTSIIGNKIDVLFDTYKEACNWGAKYVNVYVLN